MNYEVKIVAICVRISVRCQHDLCVYIYIYIYIDVIYLYSALFTDGHEEGSIQL